LALALDYRGAADFSSPLSLRAEREDLRFDGHLDVPALLAWSTASPRDSLLPPLRGRVQAALIEVSGAQLEGVVIEFEDDDAGSAPWAPARTRSRRACCAGSSAPAATICPGSIRARRIACGCRKSCCSRPRCGWCCPT